MAQQSVTAQVVGNSFVEQYYRIQHHSPQLVYKFYQDISNLGRPDDNGTMSITTRMKAIKKKILSLNYKELRAEIKSVDAQVSYNGGVHVLVTGNMAGKDNLVRNFTQSFFLAPQERGYFVLNDIFRYVEEIKHRNGDQSSVNDVEAPLTPEQDPPPVQESTHIPDQTLVTVDGSNNGVVSVMETEVPAAAEVVDEVPDNLNVEAELEVPTKSCASIETAIPFSSPAPTRRRSPAKSQEQPVKRAQALTSAAAAPVSGVEYPRENGGNRRKEGMQSCIIVVLVLLLLHIISHRTDLW